MNHSYTKTFKTLPTTFQEKFAANLELIRKFCGLDHLKYKKMMPTGVLKWTLDIHIRCSAAGISPAWSFKQACTEIATPALLLEACPAFGRALFMAVELSFFSLGDISCLEFAAGSL